MLKIWGRHSSFNVQTVLWLVGELGIPYSHISTAVADDEAPPQALVDQLGHELRCGNAPLLALCELMVYTCLLKVSGHVCSNWG